MKQKKKNTLYNYTEERIIKRLERLEGYFTTPILSKPIKIKIENLEETRINEKVISRYVCKWESLSGSELQEALFKERCEMMF